MEHVSGWFSQLWASIVHHFTHMTLGMALWLGFLLLTIVLMVLMSTRWGSVKPIWKCVILSIFAHILLGGYAYGTKLIFTSPERPPDETISLNLVDSDTPRSEAEDEVTTQARPWDNLDLSPEITPPTESVDRLQPAVQKTVTRTQPEIAPHRSQPQVPSEITGELVADLPHQSAIPDSSRSEAHRITESTADAEAIALQRQTRKEESPFTAPTTPDNQPVARMDSVQDEKLLRPAERSAPDPLADSAIDRKQLLRNLAGATSAPPQTSLTEAINRQAKGIPQSTTPGEWGKPVKRDNPFQMASAPRRLADGVPMPEIYSGRSPEKRKEKATRYGGSPETERAVEEGLQWLADNQEADGSWNGVRFGAGQERLVLGHDRKGAGTNADTGLTGISVLAFLAAGHSHLEGEHRKTVQKGLEYLLRQQAANGEMAGNAKLFARMYCHAMATLAIAETLAMTGDNRLRQPVENAINYSLKAQHPTRGGWRYRPGDEGDMSQFGWQVLVIKSAELSGIEIPERSKMLMRDFLRQCTSGQHGGLASYRPGMAPSTTMTAEALVCRYFLYDDVPQTTANEASQYLLQELPGTQQENLYYWYYGTLAMFQTGGQPWTNWNHSLTRTLVGSQVRDGDHAGSWEPTGTWAGYGGRVYSTAMATLCLEVYYRYQTR